MYVTHRNTGYIQIGLNIQEETPTNIEKYFPNKKYN